MIKTNQFGYLTKHNSSFRTKYLSMQRYATNSSEDEKRLSKKERRVDALALRADERRDKLRKAAGSGKYTMIRSFSQLVDLN